MTVFGSAFIIVAGFAAWGKRATRKKWLSGLVRRAEWPASTMPFHNRSNHDQSILAVAKRSLTTLRRCFEIVKKIEHQKDWAGNFTVFCDQHSMSLSFEFASPTHDLPKNADM